MGPAFNLSMTSEDRVWDLKGVMRQVETSGLDVEYRCVRCRACFDCKNADQTEKISLRDEQELQQHMDSVELDKVSKKVRVSLPLRGPERDFLVSNREMAEQVLVQQCKKYFGDSKTKESILRAFKKMFDPGFLVFLDDIDEDTKKQFVEKEVQYYIPWRIQFNPGSVSTPERPVFDASTKTRKRSDGTGGRCLNDLVCKGPVKTLNFLKLILRFCIGLYAFTGDIKQFYNCANLLSSQWNLQRFLYKEGLDPANETKEGIITTSIYGVKSSSCQTECTKIKLAETIQDEKPEVAVLLTESTYVDDIADSRSELGLCTAVMDDTDEVLASVGCQIKAWSRTGCDPVDKVSQDGVSLEVGGMIWYPKLDILMVKIPVLHFGKFVRGRLKPGTELFLGGSLSELDQFVPAKLTKRQVTSKLASVFDPRGKIAPVLAAARLLLRQTNCQTVGWDDPMPGSLRSRWVETFWRFEMLKGLKFSRPVMPVDARDTKMRLLTGADAADQVLVIGAWGGFQRRDNSWSCQHILGRNVLADETSTIPKKELDALCGASNMSWIVRSALGEWVDSDTVFGDSRIALCWATSENRRLGIFHRKRILQIKRGTQLERLFHVKSDQNPCDIGTRPEKVTMESVGSESVWERGKDWMCGELDSAVADAVITPALDLRLKPDEEEDFYDGCKFDKPEILTRGHLVSEVRVSKLEERAAFSDYLILPTKFSFPTVVRIHANVIKFVTSIARNRRVLKHLFAEGGLLFSIFTAVQVCDTDNGGHLLSVEGGPGGYSGTQVDQQAAPPGDGCLAPSDKHVSMAMTYLYQKASREVKQFNSKMVVNKYTVERDGILYSKGRIVDGMTNDYS